MASVLRLDARRHAHGRRNPETPLTAIDAENPMAPATTRCSRPVPAKAGIGLRFQHHQALIDYRPDVAWFEIHTENYMGGDAPLRYLDAIRRDFPVSLQGIGLSLGLKADQQRLGESP